MGLTTREKVGKLQAALHAKAKRQPDLRFHALYDKVYRRDVLTEAYTRCKANRGSAGVDGETFDDIERYGEEAWIGERADELKQKRYRPQAVRRVYIPKANGKLRPLGIPTIKDRVVQMAAVIVLEPIFEADLQPEQHAYRPERSALDAVQTTLRLLRDGNADVVDADLSGYFDSIPHAELMKSVARRICDGAMLHLIKMWLEAPIEQTDNRGQKQRSTPNKDSGRGTPQGAPISPMLSNIYMRRFVLWWKRPGASQKKRTRIVNYADDFVICCKGKADQAADAMRWAMQRLKLTVNEEKTRTCRLPADSFNFLGYTFGRQYDPRTGASYIGCRPSDKKVQGVCRKISEITSRRTLRLEPTEMVRRLNSLLRGWANYFSLGAKVQAYRAVDAHARRRLRQWLCRKHGEPCRKWSHYPVQHLYEELGLVYLPNHAGNFSWARA